MANLETRRVAELDCQFITSEKTPLFSVVLCHGFGAPGDDLVPVGAQLLTQFPELLDQVQFVFPAAPLTLDAIGLPGGRAWWPLDIDRLNLVVQKRDYSAFRKHLPPQLPAARHQLLQLIREIQKTADQSPDRILLGGFSQGAMLATDVALQLETPPAGLIVWSGTLLDEEEWTARASRLANTPVIQSHGREDEILPYEAALWLKELFVAAQAHVNFIGFRGPHTIPKEAVSAVGQLLQRLLGVIE